jgi:hypothetical protein
MQSKVLLLPKNQATIQQCPYGIEKCSIYKEAENPVVGICDTDR